MKDTHAPPPGAPPTVPRPRDLRLDVFRGLGMIIIMISHIPWNLWSNWIPARYGFSDATEMFVFMSGMASAIAFGRVFDRQGFGVGTARVAQRVWQIYWVHLAIFMVLATLVVVMGPMPFGDETYVEQLNLVPFFEDTARNLVGLMTLTYVPNYFDILPMYLVILAMMPLVVGLARASVPLALGVLVVLWACAQARLLDLPAEPWSDRTWFFNPFGWQLLFFLGFFWMRGDLPAPPRASPALLAACLAVVVVTVPFAHWPIYQSVDWVGAGREALVPYLSKTRLGILRLVHFLALAYVALWVVDRWGVLLRNGVARVLAKVGQQSLAVFALGLVLSRALGIYLDFAGREPVTYAIANVTGVAVLVATAYVVGWFKASPWKQKAPAATPPRSNPALSPAE
ncbi:OpgC family protein [Salinarimonas ramus]|uniref:Membrane protein n=1 Tax=Salinarimonas ramus TaxID=690164 RepID=A0A917V682_9HYPH|nr:OpgC domain-containing protein [Salinarimonas ramus]GGK45303.1 membrane protein [Salinarimonas ramus]